MLILKINMMIEEIKEIKIIIIKIMKKIVPIDNLENIISKLKRKGKKVVLCHGVFDLLHIGHIKHFEEARKNGDILIVSITEDRFVNKGPNRPYFNINLRSEALAALELIDYVFISKFPTAVNVIKLIKPNIYFKGVEYKKDKSDLTRNISEEKLAIKSVGGKIKFSDDITFSSSNLLNRYADYHSEEKRKYLKNIKKNFNLEKIQKMIDTFKDIKVLILGETIIDEYVFCEALGKSGKEPVLIFKDFGKERYLGGALAIARHLSSFCNNISLLSLLGEKDFSEYNKFIKNKAEKNIKFEFLKKKNSPTIVKKRFIDRVDNRKIFGIYSLNDDYVEKREETKITNKLKKLIKNFDVIIVADYGHGMITKKISQCISRKKIFFSLNAQINSTNIGLHTINKYKHIDSMVINANELRYEMNQRQGNLVDLAKKFKKKINSKYLSVTEGKRGAFTIDKNNTATACPAFAKEAIDKVGAGDAFLSVMSLCQYKNFDTSFSLFFSSIAAAKSTETIGNKEPVSKDKILKSISHLIK